MIFQIDREVETTCRAPAVPQTAKKEVYQQLDDLKAESKHLVSFRHVSKWHRKSVYRFSN